MVLHTEHLCHPTNYQRGRAQPVSFLVFHYVGSAGGAESTPGTTRTPPMWARPPTTLWTMLPALRCGRACRRRTPPGTAGPRSTSTPAAATRTASALRCAVTSGPTAFGTSTSPPCRRRRTGPGHHGPLRHPHGSCAPPLRRDREAVPPAWWMRPRGRTSRKTGGREICSLKSSSIP